MVDIMEAWPNHQGFDYAVFPINQQGQLTIFNDNAADEEVTIGIGKNNYDGIVNLRPESKATVDAFYTCRTSKFGLFNPHHAFSQEERNQGAEF